MIPEGWDLVVEEEFRGADMARIAIQDCFEELQNCPGMILDADLRVVMRTGRFEAKQLFPVTGRVLSIEYRIMPVDEKPGFFFLARRRQLSPSQPGARTAEMTLDGKRVKRFTVVVGNRPRTSYSFAEDGVSVSVEDPHNYFKELREKEAGSRHMS